jgi:TolA-binding protein
LALPGNDTERTKLSEPPGRGSGRTQLRQRLRKADRDIERLRQQNEQLHEQNEQLQRQVEESREELVDKDKAIGDKDQAIADKDKRIADWSANWRPASATPPTPPSRLPRTA